MIFPEFLADPALRRVLACLPDARIVGGAVRDAIAGLPVSDIDLATALPPDDIVKALQKDRLRVIPTGIEHGTVTALVAEKTFEITTLRRDIATDGRRATVAFTDDWRQDAARRDFTINAMSLAPSGEVFDYFSGLDDLRAGIVRFVGNPATRIAEDYLRILRFFRFHSRYATRHAAPDPAALHAIRAGVPGLAILSPERIWSEIGRILSAPDPADAVALMAELGVLEKILPAADPTRLQRLIAAGAPPEKLLRLAALLTAPPPDIATLAARLRLSTAESTRLEALTQPSTLTPTADDNAIRRALADTEPDILIDRMWLASLTEPADWPTLRARAQKIPRPVFPLEGRDVLALGLAPGPQIGALLEKTRAWWLAAGCTPDKNACRAELARHAAG